VRTETPIYVEKAVFDQAGIVATEATEATGGPDSSGRKDDIDEPKRSPFKEFIDTLEIDDLGLLQARIATELAAPGHYILFGAMGQNVR